MVDECDAQIDHDYRVPKRPIKIRNEAGQLQQSGLMIGVKDGSAVLALLNGMSCAKEDEALPRIYRHAADLHIVEASAAVSCADGHG
jgi:hypothetical protein